ncbi:hypothetical protein ACOBV9_20485 (plasmid) [Pseudoalteromonas espejiana]
MNTNHYKLFSDLSSEQSHLTGLDDAHARRAQTRDFSDPLYWHGSDELLNAFVNDVKARLRNKIGGRFIHIAKKYDVLLRSSGWLNNFHNILEKASLGNCTR